MGLGNTKIRELYETEYPTLFRIACASGLGRSFADDMVQESFQALLERRDDPKVAEHENLQGWLVVTLRNKIATELQRKWRHVEQPLSEAASRMRLIRARDSYEKWKKLEEKTEKKLLHRVQLHKYRDEEVLECPKRKEYPGAAGRAL